MIGGRRRPDARESGAATLLTIAMAGLLLLVGTALAVVEGVVVAHRHAQAAADLAALAGAAALTRGSAPCPPAGRVAGLNGSTLDECREVGSDVLVEVSVPGPTWLGQRPVLTAEARAGPDVGAATVDAGGL